VSKNYSFLAELLHNNAGSEAVKKQVDTIIRFKLEAYFKHFLTLLLKSHLGIFVFLGNRTHFWVFTRDGGQASKGIF